MGREKYKKDIEALFKKSPVVSYNSISRIIKSKKKVKGYAKRVINYLIKQGKIKKITKGYYTISDNSSLAVFCFQPAYLGLQDALSFHNLWEQETIPIIITSRNIRTGIRNILGSNVLIKRLNKKYFFGIEYYQEDSSALPYSDIEKTFIDMVYFRQPLDKETIKEFKKRVDGKKLRAYLRKYPKIFRKKVLSILS
jgi:predicted transcriptional regulator of viral defense system